MNEDPVLRTRNLAGWITIAVGIALMAVDHRLPRNPHPVSVRRFPDVNRVTTIAPDAHVAFLLGALCVAFGLFLIGYCLYQNRTRRELLAAVNKSR